MAAAAKVVHLWDRSKLITQGELSHYRELEEQMKTAEKNFEEVSADIELRLRNGAKIEHPEKAIDGELDAKIVPCGKKSVAWKNIVIRLVDRAKGKGAGELYAKKLLNKAKLGDSTKLVVVEA